MNRAVIFLLLLVACQADDTQQPLTVVVQEQDVWSGGEVVLASPDFTGADTIPLVIANHDTLAVRSLGAAQIAARLVGGPGSQELEVRLHDGRGASGIMVTAHGGFAAVASGPSIKTLLPWPGRYGHNVVAAEQFNVDSGGLLLIDLTSPGSFTAPLSKSFASVGCQYLGAGPSADGGFVMAGGGCDTVRVWLRDNAGMLVAGSKLGGFGQGSFYAYLGNGVWLKGTSQRMIRVEGMSSIDLRVTANSVLISPRGDRVVPSGTNLSGGIPVFSVPGAAEVFSVPGQGLFGMDFSEGGDTLFAGMTDQYRGQFVVTAVNATTGAVLAASDTIPSVGEPVLAAEPRRGWLYFVTSDADGLPEVHVLEKTTLRELTVLRLPASATIGIADPRHWSYEVVLDAPARRLHVVEMYNGRYYSFDVMP